MPNPLSLSRPRGTARGEDGPHDGDLPASPKISPAKTFSKKLSTSQQQSPTRHPLPPPTQPARPCGRKARRRLRERFLWSFLFAKKKGRSPIAPTMAPYPRMGNCDKRAPRGASAPAKDVRASRRPRTLENAKSNNRNPPAYAVASDTPAAYASSSSARRSARDQAGAQPSGPRPWTEPQV